MNIFQVLKFYDKEGTSILRLKYIVPPEGLSEEKLLGVKGSEFSNLLKILEKDEKGRT